MACGKEGFRGRAPLVLGSEKNSMQLLEISEPELLIRQTLCSTKIMAQIQVPLVVQRPVPTSLDMFVYILENPYTFPKVSARISLAWLSVLP